MGTTTALSGKARRRKGIAVLVTAVSMTVLVPVVGLAVDAALLYAIRGRLSAAVDAGSLAGARMLSRGQDIAAQRDNAVDTARRFFLANFPDGHLFTRNRTLNISVDETQLKVRTVSIDARVDAPLYFMRMLGQDGVNVRTLGTATRRDVNLMLVIDRSRSLETMGACGDVKEAAKSFVNYFANGRDRIGLLSFAGAYKMDFSPASNFLSASPNILSKIDAIACVGGTGTAQALTKAWAPIAAFNEPGALNALVFFTDGQPNAVVAQWPIKPHGYTQPNYSTCTSTTPKTGALTLGGSSLYGLIKYDNGAPENTVIASSGGCAFASNPSNVKNDIVNRVVAQDLFGNSTSGYRPFRGSTPYLIDNYSSTYNNNMAIAATNAANNAATTIKNHALRPIIYSIGLGGAADAPAEEFMRRVANDSLSPAYNSALPTGLYVYAPNAAQLKAAFVKIASIVLRLSE